MALPDFGKDETVTSDRAVEASSSKGSLAAIKTRGNVVLVPQPSDDPNDPLNWPQRKKYTILATLCLAGFAGTALSLANQLAFRDEAANWDKSLVQVSYTVSASIAGIAYGPLLLNPLVHIVGRSSVIFWSLVCALGCAVWAAEMTGVNDYEPFVASRLFTGIFGAIPSILGAGPILDMFFLHERGKAYATFHISFLLGTIAGPTFGGFIVEHTSWPWVFWWIVIFDGVVLVLVLLFLEETGYGQKDGVPYPPKPTGWVANRVATFLPGHKIIPKIPQAKVRSYAIAPFQIGFSPVGLLIGFFQVVSFAWFVATHNLLTVFLETPVEYGGYGFTPQRNAFFIFALWVGLGVAQIWGLAFNDRTALWICRRNGGVWKMEYRLYSLIIPQLIVLPIACGIIGAALQYHLHYMVLALGAFLLTFSSMMTVPISVNYLIECFKSRPTECSAALGAYRLSLGLAVPFFINPWVDAVGTGWAYGMMAFFTIAVFSIIPILIKFGDKIRAMSFIAFTGEDKEELGTKVVMQNHNKEAFENA